MEAGSITVDGKNLFALLKKHKHAILSKLFKSKDWSYEEKMAVMNKHLTEADDLSINCRAKCLAGLPCAENKAKVWAEIVDCDSKESINVRQAKMSGFYSWDQLDII